MNVFVYPRLNAVGRGTVSRKHFLNRKKLAPDPPVGFLRWRTPLDSSRGGGHVEMEMRWRWKYPWRWQTEKLVSGVVTPSMSLYPEWNYWYRLSTITNSRPGLESNKETVLTCLTGTVDRQPSNIQSTYNQ